MRIPTTFNRMGLSPSGGGHTWDDYIAYVSLNGYSNNADSGQTLTYSNNVSSSNFITYAGIPCVNLTNSTAQYIRLTEPSINQGSNKPRSYSCWFAMTDVANGHPRGIAIGGYSLANEMCSPNTSARTWQLDMGGYGIDYQTGVYITANMWHHYVQQYAEDGTLQLWLDGVKIGEQANVSININSTTLSIGCPTNSTYNYYSGYVAAARLWNRTLTDEEILELSNEFTPEFEIIVQDLTFSLYQKNETYGISYTSTMTPVTFEIIEGTLPNTISFNTSTGQFSGKGLTDADHTYNLKVRLTAPNSTPATCNVTIYTYKTARISLYNQSFSFISNKAESKSISYTSDESVTFTIESGTLPAGMTMTTGGTFSSSGSNTSGETQQVVVRATSANNQTGVTATMTLDMQMNAIVLNAQTLKFYTAQGVKTISVKYSGSLNPVSDAVFSMTGTLPVGVTWDATTGSFTSDGTQSADETASVSVTVSSANGTSTAATATMTLETHVGEQPIPTSGLVMYHSLSSDVLTPEIGSSFTLAGSSPVVDTVSGIQCLRFNNGGFYQQNVDYWDSSNPNVTLSIWANCNNNSNYMGVYSIGGYYQGALELTCRDTFNCIGYPVFADISYNYSTRSWHHFCIEYSYGNFVKFYVDGSFIGQRTTEVSTTYPMQVGIGNNFNGTSFPRDSYFNGWLARARIYNRILQDNEIAALASEFTPTP